jgi:hypothetical protein
MTSKPSKNRHSLTALLAPLALLLNSLAHSSEPPTNEQFAQGPESAQQAPEAYPWEAVLGEKPANAALPAASLPEGETLELTPPPVPAETPAQRYQRIVEDIRLRLPAEPYDYLAEMLEELEESPSNTQTSADR